MTDKLPDAAAAEGAAEDNISSEVPVGAAPEANADVAAASKNAASEKVGGETPVSSESSLQDTTAFDSAETIVTPATGMSRPGDDATVMAPLPINTDELADLDATQVVPVEPQIRFGRFVTEGTIGKGGMGIVFRAVDPLIGRTVAIKALRTDHGIGGDSLTELQSRFELEFKSAGNLSHPNIVTIYDVGQEEGTTFIAMEFIDGRSLEQLLREGEVLSYERVGELIEGICAGLDYAHEANIVHRDVKPANILIDPAKGRPKITDFGVAKVQSSGLTQTGTVIGTPAYMSPEQILGKAVSGRSDQFSAAVILYQMLTGVLPFGSDAPASILFRIVHSEPTPPHELNAELPEAFSEAIAKAFAKDPKDRYASCAEMAEATSRALLGKAPRLANLENQANPASFKSVTLSTTEPLRSSGTYAGAGSWWQRQNSAPRLGMSLLGALIFAAIGWVAVAKYLDKPLVPEQVAKYLPFLQQWTASPLEETATDHSQPPNSDSNLATNTASASPTDQATTGDPEPVAPVQRSYTVDSNKKGAVIRLDGEVLEGATPFEVPLTVGQEYEISASLEGYKSAGAKVTATAEGDGAVFLSLLPDIKPGRLAFTKPEHYGQLIFEIDGRRVDPNKIAPGKRTLVVKSPSNFFVSDPQTITVLEGKATTIRALPGLTKFRVIGIGAGTSIVSIDGGNAISLPKELWLARGRHKFVFTFDNGEQSERTLLIGTTGGSIVGSVDEIKVRR